MKKSVFIGIIIITILLVIGIIAFTIYQASRPCGRCLKDCIAEGETIIGLDNSIKCCPGLIDVPSKEIYSNDGLCLIPTGSKIPTICTNCGNNKCESWENQCNCPMDCTSNKGVCGNGICETGEGPGCPACDTPGNCGACATGSCPQDCKYSCNLDSDCISTCGSGCVNEDWKTSYNDPCVNARAWDCSCVNNTCYTDGNHPRICPIQKTIDCMPIVRTEVAVYCEENYRNWITLNCNVSFLD